MLNFKEKSAASVPTPPAGKKTMFLDIADSTMKTKNSLNELETLGGGGGAGEVDMIALAPTATAVTFAELHALCQTGTLVPGALYKLTDYQCINLLNSWDDYRRYKEGVYTPPVGPEYDPTNIFTGTTEELILQAISEYKISSKGYSLFNSNEVYFDPNADFIGAPYYGYTGNAEGQTDLQWDGVNNYAYIDLPATHKIATGGFLYIYLDFGTEQIDLYKHFTHYGASTGDLTYNTPVNALSLKFEISADRTKIILPEVTALDFANYVADSMYIEYIYQDIPVKGFIRQRISKELNVKVPFDYLNTKVRRYSYFSNTSILSDIVGNFLYHTADPAVLNMPFTGISLNPTGHTDYFSLPQGSVDNNVIIHGIGDNCGSWWYGPKVYNNYFNYASRCELNSVLSGVYENTFTAGVFDSKIDLIYKNSGGVVSDSFVEQLSTNYFSSFVGNKIKYANALAISGIDYNKINRLNGTNKSMQSVYGCQGVELSSIDRTIGATPASLNNCNFGTISLIDLPGDGTVIRNFNFHSYFTGILRNIDSVAPNIADADRQKEIIYNFPNNPILRYYDNSGVLQTVIVTP